MSTVTLQLHIKQAEKLVEQLSLKEKIKLFYRLEQSTWAKRLDEVVSRMRRKVKETRITDEDINRLCEEVKKEYDEKHRRH